MSNTIAVFIASLDICLALFSLFSSRLLCGKQNYCYICTLFHHSTNEIMKHPSYLCRFFSVGLSLAFSVCIIFACGKGVNSQKEQDPESENGTETAAESAGESMKAPLVTPDESGLIQLSQCPTSYDKMELTFSNDNTTVTITYDGKEIQTLSDSEEGLVATGDNVPVHFMDANFDGYVDIFIGQGKSRTYSSLLVWDEPSKQFKRIGVLGDPSYQNIMLYPSKKYVFEGGSNSWCNESFTRSIWEDGNLKRVEELCIVSAAEQYGEYQVTNKYTLRDGQQEDILSTDDMSTLPSPWGSVLVNYSSDGEL